MMWKLLQILLLPFSLLSISASGQVKSKTYNKLLDTLLSHSVNEISVKEASSIKASAIFLDAREPLEHSISHIENAIPVGYNDFDMKNVGDIPKNSNIIVYCSVGYRSEKIAEKLLTNGYTDVSNLYGGIFEWKNEGFQVYDSSGVTNNTHAYNKAWGVWLKKGKKIY